MQVEQHNEPTNLSSINNSEKAKGRHDQRKDVKTHYKKFCKYMFNRHAQWEAPVFRYVYFETQTASLAREWFIIVSW